MATEKEMVAEGKGKALDAALAQIEKQFGKGSIMRLGNQKVEKVDSISTGAITLDLALGVGGLPRGRVIEVFGPEMSGKTTLSLTAIREVQKTGGVAAFIDAEHAFDATYAKNLGVNLDDMLISQPESGEQALEIAEKLISSNAVDIIVIDSVAALTPRAEIEGEMGQSFIGLQARLMSQALRKLTATISRSKTCVIFINQLREKIGIMFGSPETTPGGRALKFYCSVRLDVRKTGLIKEGEKVIGSKVRVKVVKNKVAPPFREAEFEIYYNKGIHKVGSLVDAAINLEIVKKSGSWFSFGETKLGQGREGVIEIFEKDPKILKLVEDELRKLL